MVLVRMYTFGVSSKATETFRAVTLFLILGFATTLCLAYAAAIFSTVIPPVRHRQIGLLEPSGEPYWRWMFIRHASFGHTCLVFRRSPRHGLDWQGYAGPEVPASQVLPHWSSVPARGMKVDDHAYGWPLRCLRAVQHAGDDRADYRVLTGWHPSMGDIWLPRRFLWPTLIANTLIFAGAWWLLLVAPGMTRRSRRRRRGLCIRCAYDLRATSAGSPCPECGTAAFEPARP